MSGLNYSQNIGCAAGKDPGPGQCDGVEEFAVPHRYRYPRARTVRLYVCAFHAREHAAEPLTGDDRRAIAERRARRDEVLARVTVGPYACRDDGKRPTPSR